MHFCENCDNMYYIKIDDENDNNIIYYCKNCGNINNEMLDTTKCILKQEITQNTTVSSSINQYTKYDYTLPRINNIKCPNNNCSSNINPNDSPNEIIYIRSDHTNLKFIYLCCNCDNQWKIE